MSPVPTPDSHAHHDTPRWLLALLLAGLAMLGPFAIDTYIPAFDGMGRELGANVVQMQQTFSVYLAAFAFMFLFHGALSDSYGRKPIIIAGLIGFLFGSIGCAMSDTIGPFLLFRAVQGLSVGAGMVVGRAMIRDLFNETDAQKLMSMVTLWFGIAPAIAPIFSGASRLIVNAVSTASTIWWLWGLRPRSTSPRRCTSPSASSCCSPSVVCRA